MKTSFVILAAVGAASTVSAQAWDIEFSNPVLSPEASSTRVTLSFTPAPGDWALGAIGFNVHADEVGWSDLESLIPQPGQGTGTIHGASVLMASAGHLITSIEPTPGRVALWAATFTVTDFTPRDISIATESLRYEVYATRGSWTTSPRPLPGEGYGTIQVVPAPASLGLLGLGGVVAAGRRRRGL